MNAKHIAQPLLTWFDQYGRHDLPWQSRRSAYRVWVSEIMLQQTQVSTVIPYFERFMARFPEVTTLADAHIDEVLHLWTGLGYYARARNLHRASQYIRDHHQGNFPDTFADILALPGIGRSTAGAILAQAFEQPFAILDGNVKRVLTRVFAIDGWPGNKLIENELWDIAEQETPRERIVDYTQAIMDLGATVCRRTTPTCDACPLTKLCDAFQMNRQADFPTRKTRKYIPVRSTCMLIIVNDDDESILLEQRPPSGIWGGLWSFPEHSAANETEITHLCEQQLQLKLINKIEPLPTLRHTFSHFHLDITPLSVRARHVGIMDSDRYIWYNTRQPTARGLPAPVKTILEKFFPA
jgi:A/G-specific adenine glycosylase